MTKPGCFHFAFILLCATAKPVPGTKTFRIRHESETVSSNVNLVYDEYDVYFYDTLYLFHQ